MYVGVLGVSYRLTTLQGRERVVSKLLSLEADKVLADTVLGENTAFVLLLTCNRSEIYFVSSEIFAVELKLKEYLGIEHKKAYLFYNERCLEHLFNVTSGMDSLVFQETEIQGQVKRAYVKASSQRTLNSILHYCFQKALKVGKVSRAKGLKKSSYNMVSTVRDIIESARYDEDDKILFIGYSEINRKIAHDIFRNTFQDITFCSKKKDIRHYKLVSKEEVSFYDPYKIIFFGSLENAENFNQLNQESLSSVSGRLIFDFSVPRAITFKCLDNIRYLNMDDINDHLQNKISNRKNSIMNKKEISFIASTYWKRYQLKQLKMVKRSFFYEKKQRVLSC